MFRPTEVIAALFTRSGWQQPTEVGYNVLTEDNLVSSSGLYFSDYHKAVTVRNIKDTVQDSSISDADFNAYLIQFQKAAINKVLQGVFNRDVIIEQTQLFSRDSEKNFTELTNSSKFVGFKICVTDDVGYSVLLNSISLYFNGAVTFNMYCFHSAKGNIWTKSVTTFANAETVVDVDDLILSISKATQKAGVYYIGYFQDDLGSVKAIYDSAKDYEDTYIFGYTGFEADILTATTYDNQTIVETNKDYGLNLEFTSVRDFTNLIIRNAKQFDRAIGLQVACDVIEQIIMSTRSNATERLNKEFAAQIYNDLNLATINDTQPYSTGLKNQLTSEIQRLNRNLFPKDQAFILQT